MRKKDNVKKGNIKKERKGECVVNKGRNTWMRGKVRKVEEVGMTMEEG